MSEENNKARVLVIDDDASALYGLRTALESLGYEVMAAQTAAEGIRLGQTGQFDVVLTDWQMPDLDGLDLIKALHAARPGLPIILITGHHLTETVIEATRLGAYDYVPKPKGMAYGCLLKPPDMDELRILLEKAVASKRAQEQVEVVQTEEGPEELIVGRTPAMRQVYMDIGRVAAKPATVLVRGETGTGKELVARAIYQHSERSKGPFVIVNCVAIAETLLEKELFGSEAGAFTGAQGRLIGKFEQAHHGTLFLDEIGDISPAMQAKLLRVLEEKRIQRLGGHEVITLDVRVITATHANLEKAVEDRRFRPDLYYRLNDAVIRVPSLRERRDDIPALVASFLLNHPRSAQLKPVVTDEAMEFLKHCDWPGNVRELKNVVYKAVMEAHGYPIDIPMLRKVMKESRLGEPGTQQKLEAHVSSLLVKASQGRQNDVRAAVHEWAERELYTQAWTLAGGDQTRLAKWLGVSRPTVRQKLKTFGLREPTAAEAEGK
jgi:DNA-binding NtrC family response regulator